MNIGLQSVKKIIVPVYYIAISVFLFTCSVLMPFQFSEQKRIAYTNELFLEYKQANGLEYVDENNAAAKQIRSSGHQFGQIEYKRYSGQFGLLACLLVLGVILLFSFAKQRDVVLVGGYFSILFAYGSMSAEFYLGDLILAWIAYFLKRHLEMSRGSQA